MVKEIKNKKGDLTSKQIVTLIASVIGFGIVLLLLWQYNWRGQIDREACHQSVIFRTASLAPYFVPLRCKTERICMSGSLFGGECENMKTDFTKARVKTQDDINREISNSMYDCWTMLGEGKIDFMRKDWNTQIYCFICSRIAFDKNVQEKFKDDGIKGLDVFLATENPLNKEQTYLSLFTGGDTNYVNLNNEIKTGTEEDIVKLRDELEKKGLQLQEEFVINPKDEVAVIYTITKPGHWKDVQFVTGVSLVVVGAALTIVGAGIPVAAAGSGILAAMAAAVGSKVIIMGGLAAAGYGATTGTISFLSRGEDKSHQLTLVKYDVESLKKIGCTEFETIP